MLKSSGSRSSADAEMESVGSEYHVAFCGRIEGWKRGVEPSAPAVAGDLARGNEACIEQGLI